MEEGTIIIDRTDDEDFPFTVFRVDSAGDREYVDSCPDFQAAEQLARLLPSLWRA